MNERNYWTRMRERRLHRRALLSASARAGVGAAGIALVGCGDDDDDDGQVAAQTTDQEAQEAADQAAQAGQAQAQAGQDEAQADEQVEQAVAEGPRVGGEMVLGMGGSPRSLDPHFDTFPFNTWITNNTNNALLRFLPDFSGIEPELATAMPETPDDQTYIVEVHDGVRWQNIEPVNGRLMTSADVKFSIDRQMTDEAGKFQHAYFFLGQVDEISTPDERTVTFHTVQPYAPMLSYLASPWTVIINREAVEEYGDLTEQAVGTGPFILKNWTKDVSFELERNPDYWEEGLPRLDRLTFLIITDPETMATQFIDRRLDAVTLGPAQKDRVLDGRGDADYGVQGSQFWRQMRMPPTTPENPYPAPFDDPRVRQAIVQAVDKIEVLDLVYSGDGIITRGPILPIYPLWALEEELAPFDLQAAQELLDAAGNPEVSGPMIWASTSTQADQIGEVLKQQLARIGVDIELTPQELAAYYNQTYSYEYFMSHHVPLNNPDPDENLSSYFGRNSTFFKHYNEEIWDLIDQQAVTLDLEARQQIVDEAQRKIVLDYPMRFMFTTNRHDFVDPSVQGWRFPTDLYDGRVHGAWLNA